MTAPALNPAQSAMPGLNAATSGANAGQANGALAGFEALMAALFPQADAAVAAPAATAAAPAPVAADPLLAAVTDMQAAEGEDVPVEVDADVATTATDAAAAALMADAIVMQAAPAPVAETAKSAPVEAEGSAAKAAAPATPVQAPFVPAVDTAEAAEPTATTEADAVPVAEGDAEPTPPTQLSKLSEDVARPAQPPAGGATKLPDTFTTLTAPQPHTAATATAKPAVAQAPVEQPETPAAVAVAAEQAASAAPATVAAKPEPAPPRGSKSERKTSAEPTTASATSVDAKPAADVVDAPVAPKAKDAVTAAAQGPVEAVERKDGEAKPAADSPDFTVQAEARASSTSDTAPAESSAHPVRGAPETVANLAAQIVKKLEAKTTRFDVALDPHGLGKVDVRVEIGADGRITAAMTFDNPQAAQDVKARASELQRALEQAGFDLSGGALSFDVAQDRGQGGQGRAWQQQEQNETGSTFRGQAFRAALETAGDAANAANQGALRLSRGVRSGLDVRI